MATKLDLKEMVTLEELIMSNVFTQEENIGTFPLFPIKRTLISHHP